MEQLDEMEAAAEEAMAEIRACERFAVDVDGLGVETLHGNAELAA